MAPTYATLTMGFLEGQILNPVLTELYGMSTANDISNNWLRYLDDCFILWKPNYGNIKDLIQALDNLHPKIKFTMETSEEQISFLDIVVYKEDTMIKTDIFHKPTDTFQYLHFSSCHPRHIKNNIPFNLARRICTIVSDEQRKEQRLKELNID
jgi:hypothetical protein